MSAYGDDGSKKKSQETYKIMANIIQRYATQKSHILLTDTGWVPSEVVSTWVSKKLLVLEVAAEGRPELMAAVLDKLVLKEKETEGFNVAEALSLLHHEALRKSMPETSYLVASASTAEAEMAASVPFPSLQFPTEKKELLREMLLKSLDNMFKFDSSKIDPNEPALSEKGERAQKVYNRLLEDEETTREGLKKELQDEAVLTDPKLLDDALERAWNFLQDINANFEFLVRGYTDYPKRDKEIHMLQKTYFLSPGLYLRGISLKLPPQAPITDDYLYMLLDKDDRGLVGTKFDKNGIAGATAPLKTGRYSFVISKDAPNQIRIGQGHSVISAKAEEVLFAGELHVETRIKATEPTTTATSSSPPPKPSEEAFIKSWTNDSGHYGTDPSMLFQTIAAAKDSLGGVLLDPKIYIERNGRTPRSK